MSKPRFPSLQELVSEAGDALIKVKLEITIADKEPQVSVFEFKCEEKLVLLSSEISKSNLSTTLTNLVTDALQGKSNTDDPLVFTLPGKVPVACIFCFRRMERLMIDSSLHKLAWDHKEGKEYNANVYSVVAPLCNSQACDEKATTWAHDKISEFQSTRRDAAPWEELGATYLLGGACAWCHKGWGIGDHCKCGAVYLCSDECKKRLRFCASGTCKCSA